ncbi:MAG: histidinol-phosphate aminotransferase family protein [Dehalococcoidia bacterium]|nr:histidinol-phosphate aminotransferase family protein [Dehalococcoidia bacterium]
MPSCKQSNHIPLPPTGSPAALPPSHSGKGARGLGLDGVDGSGLHDSRGLGPVHGGLDPQELEALGLRPEEVLDFSASINPLGPPPCVRKALVSLDLSSYPDRECRALRAALARRLEVSPDWILVGNGSTELIHLLARALLRPGDRAAIFTPTFGEYEAACRLSGAEVVAVQADENNGFRWDTKSAAAFLSNLGAQHAAPLPPAPPRLLFLCNPNNPTGVYLSRAEVERIVTALPDTIVVLDEAYATFADEPWDSIPLLKHPNVVLLHSMTKSYAIPSLRLGYAVTRPELLREMARYQPSWSVNGFAQTAGVVALREDPYLQVARAAVQESKAYLRNRLGSAGLRVVMGAANFLLVDVGDARAVRRRLLEQRLCVRDCASFGLPRYIRIGIRTLPDCQQLVEALLTACSEKTRTAAPNAR